MNYLKKVYYLYILLCDKSFFYTGITNNINKRLEQHQRGESPHTSRYQEIELLYDEQYLKRVDAEKREEQIKGWSKEKKKALIEGNIERLKQLSKSKS